MKLIFIFLCVFSFVYSECINVGKIQGDNHNLRVESCTNGIKFFSSNGVETKIFNSQKIDLIVELLKTVQFGETFIKFIDSDLIIKSRVYSSKEYFLIFDISNLRGNANVWIPYNKKDKLLNLLITIPNKKNLSSPKGTILNAEGNLMYQDNIDSANKKLDWKDSLKYCQNLNLNNHQDWTLPTIEELEKAVNFINFKNQNYNGYYWSLTKRSKNVTMLMDVEYSSKTYSDDKYKRNFRCVRRIKN